MNIWMKIEQKCSITNFHLKKYFGDFQNSKILLDQRLIDFFVLIRRFIF